MSSWRGLSIPALFCFSPSVYFIIRYKPSFFAATSLFLYRIPSKEIVQMPIGGHQSNLDINQKGPELPQCPREWQWACRNGECIARYDTCDGITQCSDGSDEWNCEDWDRMKQDHGFQHGSGITQPKPPAITTTTTLAPDSSYVVLSTRQIYFTFLIFVLLSLALIWVIRRRARQRALMRNRRGNILSAQDSDEDDVLISSMYS